MKKISLLVLISLCKILFSGDIDILKDTSLSPVSDYVQNIKGLQISKYNQNDFLKIGNSLYDMALYKEAKYYYKYYLKHNKDDKIALRFEEIRFILGEYITPLAFLKNFVEKHPKSSYRDYIILQIVKEMIYKQQYWQTIEYINIAKKKSHFLDYFRALCYQKLKMPSSSAYVYGLLLKKPTLSRSLARKAMNFYKIEISKLPWPRRVKRVSKLISTIPKANYKVELMLFLAKIYEENFLFFQANDVYYWLIEFEKDSKFYINIIQNNLETKNYQESLKNIESFSKNSKDKKTIQKLRFSKHLIAKMMEDDALAERYAKEYFLDFPFDEKIIEPLLKIYKQKSNQETYYLIKNMSKENDNVNELKKIFRRELKTK